jgi:hypothetical protein
VRLRRGKQLDGWISGGSKLNENRFGRAGDFEFDPFAHVDQAKVRKRCTAARCAIAMRETSVPFARGQPGWRGT